MISPPGAVGHLPDALTGEVVDPLRCQPRSGLVDVIGFCGVDSGSAARIARSAAISAGAKLSEDAPAVKKAPPVA